MIIYSKGGERNMSRFVLLTRFYLGAATANGICARNIVNELRRRNHDVEVICYEDNKDKKSAEIGTYIVDGTGNCLETSFVHKFSTAMEMFLGRVPNTDIKLVSNYYGALTEINNKNPIDALVAVYFPRECVEAMCLFKEEHKSVKAIIYELDSVGDGISSAPFKNIYRRNCMKWMSKAYEKIDNIIIMQSHEPYWRNIYGSRFSHKMQTADIPVLTEKRRNEAHNAKISMIYAGLIKKKYRSPSFLLSVLEELKDRLNYEFSFYSRGDCADELIEAAANNKKILNKGYVPQEILDEVILASDVLVSIGNASSRCVPSKVITYISYGKPIIHFASQKDDVCNEYFEKYKLALVVDQTRPVEEACKNILEFLERIQGVTVEYAEIKKMFYQCTPEYSAGIIIDTIVEGEKL